MTRHACIWRLLASLLLASAASAFAQPEPSPGVRQYVIPLLLPASNPTAEGFVRLVNLSDESGEVRIVAVDDAGRRFGPISLTLEANAATHFGSADLERGSAAKGLPRGVGDGTGGEPVVYLSSADWMGRNFFDRVETCFPVEDEALKAAVTGDLELYLADSTAWQLGPDGTYTQREAPRKRVAAQEALLKGLTTG